MGKVVATRAVHMVEKKGKIPLNLPFPKGEVSPFDRLRVSGESKRGAAPLEKTPYLLPMTHFLVPISY
jgi:hypothetical protein